MLSNFWIFLQRCRVYLQHPPRLTANKCIGCGERIHNRDNVLDIYPLGLLHDDVDCVIDHCRKMPSGYRYPAVDPQPYLEAMLLLPSYNRNQNENH